MKPRKKKPQRRTSRLAGRQFIPPAVMRYTNTVIMLFLIWFFLIGPLGRLLQYLGDTGLQGPQAPDFAYELHESQTPRFLKWAQQRLDESFQVRTEGVEQTEWPLFCCFFYLETTRTLEEQWTAAKPASDRPAVYARRAVQAAVDLVLDPRHGRYVKEQWGDDYLDQDNLFYRALQIAAMISHRRITDQDTYEKQIALRTDRLAEDIEKSPAGLLEDYPGQCYPGDVLLAGYVISEADRLLGTSHQTALEKIQMAFARSVLDENSLPPFTANALTGETVTDATGCSTSYALLFTPHFRPDMAKKWYRQYEKRFWQCKLGFCGFREYPTDNPANWLYQVDAGPVVAGYGVSANVFGIGAARANGRFDHACPLSAVALACSWPLPNDILLLPRIVSQLGPAPLIGETAILYNMTRMPAAGTTWNLDGKMPKLTYAVCGLYLFLTLLFVGISILSLYRWLQNPRALHFSYIQLLLWLGLLAAALFLIGWGYLFAGLVILILIQVFPRFYKNPPEPETDKSAEQNVKSPVSR